MAAIHAFLVITLRASQIVSGLALTIFAGAVGLSSYLGNDLQPRRPARATTRSRRSSREAMQTLAGRRPDRLRPGHPRVPLVGARGRAHLVPEPHAARAQRARGRRVAGRRRRDGHQRRRATATPTRSPAARSPGSQARPSRSRSRRSGSTGSPAAPAGSRSRSSSSRSGGPSSASSARTSSARSRRSRPSCRRGRSASARRRSGRARCPTSRRSSCSSSISMGNARRRLGAPAALGQPVHARGAMWTSRRSARWLEELGSSAPAPGGGAAAALEVAMGAALVEMVCNLTIGKPAFAEHEAVMTEARDRRAALRVRGDRARGRGRGRVLRGDRRLPAAEGDQGRPARRRGSRRRSRRPPTCRGARRAAASEVLDLAERIVPGANPNVVSDAAVAAGAARGALQAALVNIDANRASITDASLRARARRGGGGDRARPRPGGRGLRGGAGADERDDAARRQAACGGDPGRGGGGRRGTANAARARGRHRHGRPGDRLVCRLHREGGRRGRHRAARRSDVDAQRRRACGGG